MAKLLLRCGLGLLCVAALSACASSAGDLGRAAPKGAFAEIRPQVDRLVKNASGKPVSDLPLSDEERLLEARLWRFYRFAQSNGKLLGDKEALDKQALLDGSAFESAIPSYYTAVAARNYRSSQVRYRALQGDIDKDNAALPDVFNALCAVMDLDEKRRIAADHFSELEPATTANLALRIEENQTNARAFALALEFRYESYSYALKRLLLDAPYEQARGVDAALSELATALDRVRAGRYCAADKPIPSTDLAKAIQL